MHQTIVTADPAVFHPALARYNVRRVATGHLVCEARCFECYAIQLQSAVTTKTEVAAW